ncbi:hypothetical protein TOPH_06294 [Tolypocladium ophioglossoides CBS 100239]|uniref:Glycosyl transferase n=1 Tax=Tolypocladium ophioglossoides (strain CBS 100239) TaxID=1163406 RepID=A0A0L0N4N7_TOLOC|nr:hypothetical protein TOPH_06294 [Tolypocladium ophioglossoides CBS 100239]
MKGPPASRIVAAAITILVFASSITYYLTRTSRFAYPTFRYGSVPDGVCDGNTDDDVSPQKQVIPNLVHYVWLLKDGAAFQLGFKAFVSIYSAHLFLRPERIYIHTDASPETLSRARLSGTAWTKRALAIPGLTANHVEARRVTTKGVEIVQMEHKADFLRMLALRDFGGVYLDIDAVPLRDVADLRNSGFANVLGGATALSMKHSGYINNGVMMSVPNSNLMKIYNHAAHEFFDGAWATASIHLLTDLANRLLPLPSEVLILQPQAFAPTSWELEDQKRLFLPRLHASTAHQWGEVGDGPAGTCRDALAWLRRRENDETETWELDFSSTYVLHAFDDEIARIRGWDHEIDVGYVLSRQSNYACAVYPAVWDAVQRGIIPADEVG